MAPADGLRVLGRSSARVRLREKDQIKRRSKSSTRTKKVDIMPDMVTTDIHTEVHTFLDSDLEISANTERLSLAPSEENGQLASDYVPHHQGPAMFDHHIPDRAYLEASMSFRVLGGELKELLQRPKSVSGKSRGRSKHPKWSKRRPESAPADRRGRPVDCSDMEEEDEDVFERLYRDAHILPKDADYADPGYLKSIGFSRKEIKEMLSKLKIDSPASTMKSLFIPATEPGMARISSASDIPTMVGDEVGFVHYDEKTGRKSTITLREKEKQAQEWRRRIEVRDSDLDAFRLQDGKINPPLDVNGKMQWAPTSTYPNLVGSPSSIWLKVVPLRVLIMASLHRNGLDTTLAYARTNGSLDSDAKSA